MPKISSILHGMDESEQNAANIQCTRHERDLDFDQSLPVQMNGTEVLKNTVPSQSHPIHSKNTVPVHSTKNTV
jgi:hypothetical protein